jgi:hypothetical protein
MLTFNFFLLCSVHTWSGQCNKNLGNAFVIVWRIGDEHTLAANARKAGAAGRLRGSSVGASTSGLTGGESMSSGGLGVPQQPSSPLLRGLRKRSGSGDSDSSASSVDLAAVVAAAEATKRRQANVDLRRVPGVDILADQALIGYCKIIAEINRNKHVMRYRQEPRLTDKGKHEFKVGSAWLDGV